MRNILSSLGLLCLLFAIYITFVNGSKNTKRNTIQPAPGSVQQTITQVPLPVSMTFAGETVPLHIRDVRERLDRELTSITFRHSHTIRIMKLAERTLPTIERVLAENGVHDDFKYVALAESSLENLTSPKHAKGYWQFLSSTAKSYGLEVSDDVEERYHLEKSTKAAAKYFKDAYKKFNSWTMATASYNRGMAGINRDRTNQKKTDYYDLYLNSETYRYVFRILAYKQLMTNPNSYGYYFNKEDLYPEVPHTKVEVKSIPNIADFAAKYGKNYKEIKLLNPWLKKAYLKAKSGKTYTIKVPL